MEQFHSKLLDDIAKLSDEVGEATYESVHEFMDKAEALIEAEAAARS